MIASKYLDRERSWKKLEWFLEGIWLQLGKSSLVNYLSLEQLSHPDIVDFIAKSFTHALTDSCVANTWGNNGISRDQIQKVVEEAISDWIAAVKARRDKRPRRIGGSTPQGISTYIANNLRRCPELLNPHFQDKGNAW